jgi:hypothetical protein
MPKWRDHIHYNIRSTDGKYQIGEFYAWKGGRRDGGDVYIHVPTRTFWTQEEVDALFPPVVSVETGE